MKKLRTLLVLLCTLATLPVLGTHIRAGEISVRRVSCNDLTFLITFTGYEDTDSPVVLGLGEISFGDGTTRKLEDADFEPVEELVADGVRMRRFTLVHTYEAVGTYVIRFQEFNRNEGVLNMGNSVNTAFYVETMIAIDPFLGCNNTPVFLVPPIDRGAKGIPFFHNPGAWDADGDSLAYFLEINKQDFGVPVLNYQFPNAYDTQASGGAASSVNGGPPVYTIDPIKGTLIWDSPFFEGEYNVAFSVAEYRKVEGEWRLLGYVVRDMQIIVEETDNEPPKLIVPNDTCVEAGTLLTAAIFGEDPDGDPVLIEGFGGVFDRTFPGAARLLPDPPRLQPVPAVVEFNWNTLCQHVRERPYEIQFRITDKPSSNEVALTRYENWNVTVVAPAPKNLAAEVVQGTSARLNWEKYDCGNAYKMEVYRRVDSFDFDATGCNVGIPKGSGYKLVTSIGIGETDFLDNNDGQGLAPGATYCYRLVAVFPEPGGGESYASEEVCVTIEADAPVITEVSVQKTSESEGEISLSWLPPFDLDTLPYSYEVFRMTGLSGGTDRTLITTTSAQSFLDTGLDTENNAYHYEIVAFDNSGIVVDTSARASSVVLVATPLFQSIEVSWSAEVPWSNNVQEYPYHYVYRNRTDAFQNDEVNFILIDSVNVNGKSFSYLDDGRFDGVKLDDTKEYCYFITTQGSYGNDKTAALDPLLNNSQIICGKPNDTIPPCPIDNLLVANPDGSTSCGGYLAERPCGFSDFSNLVTWNYPNTPACEDEIRGFNVYYSRSGEVGTFKKIAFTEESKYLHEGLNSFAGCYQVSSVDRSGNESKLSLPFCRDNCPQYFLPDVITINGDGINETLVALGDPYRLGTGDNRCPRFVNAVKFIVVNRWGDKVYEYNTREADGLESTIYINWDGKATNGDLLSEGAYFYRIEVTYETLNPQETVEDIKGILHIINGVVRKE